MSAAITFGIPYHSGPGYLREALESVRAQTRDDWRAIVADDGGDAGEVVASFADDRVRYARNDPPRGMVGNWNGLLDAAETDLVTLLHADDRLLPHYADALLAVAARHPDAVAYHCEAGVIGPDGRPRFSLADRVKPFLRPGRGEVALAGEPALRALAAGNFIMCPTLCFRRSRLGARRFDPRWRQVQDLDLTTRLLLEGETIVGTPARAYAYRRHDESATARQSESLLRFEEECAFLDELADRCEARGWRDAARVARGKRVVKLHLAWRALGDVARLRLGAARAKLRLMR